MTDPSGISNKQRFLYILDILAEPFPESAKIEACGCGANGNEEKVENAKAHLYAIDGPMLSKRDLIEMALLDAFGAKNVKNFEEFVDSLNDEQMGLILQHFDINMIDQHLRDLALFLDDHRAIKTTFEEIKKWDKRHKNDFNQNQ